jgi:hypothetical protein
MARLNRFLYKIGAEESDMCGYGQASETIEHFLFRCMRWTAQRECIVDYARMKMGNLSFFLGGKAASDSDKWQLDIQAVRATIKFAMATGRLDTEHTEERDSTP